MENEFLKKEDLKDIFNNNKEVIVGLYDNSCEISKLYIGVLNKLSRQLKNVKLYLLETKFTNEKNIVPVTYRVSNGKIQETSYGFKKISTLIKELKINLSDN